LKNMNQLRKERAEHTGGRKKSKAISLSREEKWQGEIGLGEKKLKESAAMVTSQRKKALSESRGQGEK